MKRAEAGEAMLITVSGRPSAVLGPVGRKAWHSYDEIAEIFSTPTDPVRVAAPRRRREAL